MPTTRFGRETSKIFTTGGTGRHETSFTTRRRGSTGNIVHHEGIQDMAEDSYEVRI
jgi:hypothetical protein